MSLNCTEIVSPVLFVISEMLNMIKKLPYTLVIILITVTLTACASPEEKAASYIANANTLVAEGNLEKAEIEYKNALQINQNLPDALYGLAKIYERRQEWREAYAVVSKIRELAPRHVDGRIMLAQLLLASNQLDEALSDAKEIMELAPEDARAHSLMATLQIRLENPEGALEEASKALAIEPGNSDAILVQARVFIAEKNYDSALKLLDKAIEESPDNAFLYLMQLEAYQALADKKAVEGVYLTLIDRFPNEAGYKSALARYYIIDRNVDGAERMLEQIVASDPDSIASKLRLVAFKYQYRSIDAAVALANKYIASSPKEYPYRFLLGELFERDKQPGQAASVYQKIIADDGLQANGLEARNKLASIEKRRGNADKAAELINEVLTQDLANKNGLLLQAEFQIAGKKYDDALISARTVLRDNPDSIKAMELIGQAYDAMGSRDLAIESYSKAIQLNPGSAVIVNRLANHLVRRGDFKGADEILLESIARGNRSLESVQLLAQVKLALGQWDQAELLSNELQNAAGQQALSQQLLGIVYQGKDDQQASIEAFQRAHELAPSSTQPIAALVQTYMRNGKPEDARRFLESVVSIDSDNLAANLLLGRLSLYEKDVPGAINQYDKAIKANPRAAEAYHELATLYIGLNNLDKAAQVTNRGLAALPDRPLLMINLAVILELKGDFRKAIETYESLLEKTPDLMVAKNNLASLLTDYGDEANALERARAIAAELKNSKIPTFLDTYAWASVKAGTNLEEATVLLEAIVRENEQIGVYSYHLGEAYRKKGDIESAVIYLQKAVDLEHRDSLVARQAGQSLQQIKQ